MDTIDIDKNEALELGMSFVGDEWKTLKEDDIAITSLRGGYSGRLIIVEDVSKTCHDNPNKKFLVRLYGGKLVDKNDIVKAGKCETSEGLVFYANGLNGLGPKLLGVFEGGRVEEFVPSHRLSEKDLVDPRLSMELARKLARFHALKLPVSKKRRDLLAVSGIYQDQYNKENLMKIIKEFSLSAEECTLLEESYHNDHKLLRSFESKVGGRIVFCHGDLNKNNILVRDTPDQFNERIMLIDYELAATDYRGVDLSALLLNRMYEMKENGEFFQICEWPDYEYRRLIATEYLNETKKLNYFEFDENGVDSLDHVMMEIDFFVMYGLQFFIGFMKKMTNSDYCFKIPAAAMQSFFGFRAVEALYISSKKNFLEKYSESLID
ncbi:Choline kinase alpha [Pseudolycoriella hygida]|uniref:Choline kinase alpha n=1 Tax=Pseudolycoriella hygida TaxID=35572 RepID=A0A9Q0NB75_9DIPT|nr:Choline kinase alpha [Pseudolycoriella hygida]